MMPFATEAARFYTRSTAVIAWVKADIACCALPQRHVNVSNLRYVIMIYSKKRNYNVTTMLIATGVLQDTWSCHWNRRELEKHRNQFYDIEIC